MRRPRAWGLGIDILHNDSRDEVVDPSRNTGKEDAL
jgi:hypothetical protein